MVDETSCDSETAREIERACRESYGRLIAYLAAGSSDLAAAEDALSDAFASALASWPMKGVPLNPDAWLLTAARRNLIDQSRRSATRSAAQEKLIQAAEEAQRTSRADAFFPDERLKLMFVCAHAAIDPTIRTPLMLQTVLGLDAATISSAFLVAPKTMGQRLSRAKAKIRDVAIRFRVPEEEELHERIHAVQEAIYAAFGLAWELVRNSSSHIVNLSEEAIWLARILDDLLPENPETLGLLSLMLHCHARRRARRSAEGAFVPLGEQDTSMWDTAMTEEAEKVLRRAGTLRRPGPFQMEAAIQSAHAARRMTGKTDWHAIVLLYEALVQMAPTVGARIAAAAAIGRTGNLAIAMASLDQLNLAAVQSHQPFWVVRAHLLAESGRHAEAKEAYTRAMGLTEDPAQRRYLSCRRRALDGGDGRS
ncbi:MAG: DUF6596 domain-containing protein [Planctomycetota bacterium]